MRFRDAVKESTQEAQALAQRGACPPHLKRDPPNSGLRSQSGGNNAGSNSGVGGKSQATCSDTRAVRLQKYIQNYCVLQDTHCPPPQEIYLVSTTSVNGIPIVFFIVPKHITTSAISNDFFPTLPRLTFTVLPNQTRMAKDLKHYLHPPTSPCDCSDPTVLTDLLPTSHHAQNGGAPSPSGSHSQERSGLFGDDASADQRSALRNAFAVHCAHATGFEGRACGGLVK